MVKRLAITLVAVVALACGDDGPSGLDPTLYELLVVAGDGQSGLAGTALGEPLAVTVRRRDSGLGREQVMVRWAVVVGDGEATRGSSLTDADGVALTHLLLGSQSGTLQVEARVAGLEPVIFADLGALPGPTIQSSSPTPVTAGDTLIVRVRDLPAGWPVEVLFEGVPGAIVSREDGPVSILYAVVPTAKGACAGTTASLDLRVRVDTYTSPAQSILVTVPDEPFQVGRVLVIEGTGGVECAILPAGGGTANYMVAVLNADFEGSGSSLVFLDTRNLSITPVASPQLPADAEFDGRLRAFERRLAALGLTPPREATDARLFALPVVGDTRDFWVIADPDAVGSGLEQDDFSRVTGRLEFVGGRILLYVDVETQESSFSDSDIEALGELYDHVLYDTGIDYFGQPTDVDNNDRVIVLLTPGVNRLTPRGSAGVTIAFFFSLDLSSPDQRGCEVCRLSNGGEILYGLVPDPDGQFSDPRSRDWVMDLLPGILIHETEHMINYRYKAFENRTALEALWLSEGLAHMAEELGGDAARAAGLDAMAERLYASGFSLAAAFLGNPSGNSLTTVEGLGSSGERGAAWLFLRWLAEQYGDFFIRGLAQAPEQGVENVEARTGESFFRLFADWAVALWADDLEIPDLAARYQIPKWTLRSILVDDGTPGGSPVYKLQPQRRSFADLRRQGTTGLVAAGSPMYVELDADGDTAALALRLTVPLPAGLAILRYQ
jgi:hypothetical protein